MKRSALPSAVSLVSAAPLHCRVIPRLGLCREHTGTLWPSRLLSHVAAAEGYALQPLAQPALASPDSPGHTSIHSSTRRIQSDSTAALWLLSSRHLPHKSLQSLLAWDHCQALKHWQCPSLVKYCHPHQPRGEAGLTEHIARSVHTAGLQTNVSSFVI